MLEQARFNPNSSLSTNGLYGITSPSGALSAVGECAETTVIHRYSSVSNTRPNAISLHLQGMTANHVLRGFG